MWSRKNGVPDRTATRWATEPKGRAKIKTYRRRALDRAIGRLAGMVQIVCFGRNMLWRHRKVAFRESKGDPATVATLHCKLLLNHARSPERPVTLLARKLNHDRRHRSRLVRSVRIALTWQFMYLPTAPWRWEPLKWVQRFAGS